MLEACWKSFRSGHLGNPASGRGLAFRSFCQTAGLNAERFALFEALHDYFLHKAPHTAYWRHWPPEYHDPDGPAAAAFAAAHRERVDFHLYLQWLADQQLETAQDGARAAGMPVGIYRDLGVGIVDDGAEAWANQRLLCLGVAIGAPPDPLNLAGQDWGLAPFNPIALKEAAYLPFLDVLEANMSHAGAMRLDHAISLQRLYWVPRGAKADQGAYVRYPVEDLFALVVLASRRKRCLVIGEDLGTVPDSFRPRMKESGLLGYRLLVFEKEADRMKAPAAFPAQALVAFGTHDLPSLAGWWRGIDVAARRNLDIYPDPAMGVSEADQRESDRRSLIAALVAERLLDRRFPTAPDLSPEQMDRLSEAVHLYMCRTPSKLLMVQFEDVLGLAIQMNLPGTTREHPNWQLRYPRLLVDMLADGRLGAITRQLSKGRSGHKENRD